MLIFMWFRNIPVFRRISNPPPDEWCMQHLGSSETTRQPVNYKRGKDQRNTRSIPREDEFGMVEHEKYHGDEQDVVLLNHSKDHIICTCHFVLLVKLHILGNDVLIKVNHKNIFNTQLLCRFGFNTSFIENKCEKFPMRDLDPWSLWKEVGTDGK